MLFLGALTRGIASFLGYGVALDIPSESNIPFNPLTATVADLRRLLANETVSSAFLMEHYLAQIKKHNKKGTHAVSITAPKEDLIERARYLDGERMDGHVRGPLHGIPVLVEDSRDLQRTKTENNTSVVVSLTKAGMITIGKITTSNLAGSKAGENHVSVDCSPASFAPIIIVTDIDGGFTQLGLYSMQATTFGTTPGHAAIAKTPQDLAEIMSILTSGDPLPSSSKASWKGLRIGYLDPASFQPLGDEDNEDFRQQMMSQQYQSMASAMAKISAAGARVQRSVSLRTLEDLANCEDALGLALNTEGLIDSVSSSPAPVRSPDPSPATNTSRNLAQTAINQTFNEWDVDVIMGPAGNGIARVAATAGYPVGAVPLRVADLDGRAFGVQVIARPREEDTMMSVMIAWEGTVSLEVGKALDMAS